MLQRTRQAVSSTIADSDDSLEKVILSALSIVVKTLGGWYVSLLHERRKCLRMETQEAIKQTAQATKSIWGHLYVLYHRFLHQNYSRCSSLQMFL